MVINNFDDELSQLCLCGHLGCIGDTIEECLLENNVADECECQECICEKTGECVDGVCECQMCEFSQEH